MNNKAMAILVLAGVVAIVLSSVEKERPVVAKKVGGYHGSIESAAMRGFILERPLPDSCINRYREEGEPGAAQV